MVDNLITATWGLVVVTALLVAASTIPVVLEYLKRRSQLAARFVPDMHILNSRLKGRMESLIDTKLVTGSAIADIAETSHKDLEIVARLIEVRGSGLKFTNELYICRHLLTYASQDLHSAAKLANSHEEQEIRRRDAMIARACQAYGAASITLTEAEALLPKSDTLIDGEQFWDRFARVSDERERKAAILITDLKQRDRTRTGRPNPL